MERIDDRSKALSFIGIEIAEALKYIPAPMEDFEEIRRVEEAQTEEVETQKVTKAAPAAAIVNEAVAAIVPAEDNAPVEENVEATPEYAQYLEETRFDVRPSLWQRVKNSKFIRAIKYVMQIRVVLDYPALPEGKGENY